MEKLVVAPCHQLVAVFLILGEMYSARIVGAGRRRGNQDVNYRPSGGGGGGGGNVTSCLGLAIAGGNRQHNVATYRACNLDLANEDEDDVVNECEMKKDVDMYLVYVLG